MHEAHQSTTIRTTESTALANNSGTITLEVNRTSNAPQYTTRLSSLQDDLDPMPFNEVRAVVEAELLGGQPLSSIFRSFDQKPLGSASIAQVHEARLLDGRRVAVKVQRPNCEQKLLGDVKNLKTFAQRLASWLPVDYYTVLYDVHRLYGAQAVFCVEYAARAQVFCELERALQGELDFLQEAQAAMKAQGPAVASPMLST